jgi:hypothetical protein
MQPLTSVADLGARLRWPDVVQSVPMSGLRLFTARPTDPALPTIEFLFDDGVTILQQLGIRPWHGHFTEYDGERRNVRRAIGMARALVAGARCLLVQRSAGGTYLGSGVHRVGEMPLTLTRDFGRLECQAFNRPTERVPIDLARYYRAKDGSYIEHGWRQSLKSIYAGTPLESRFD